MLCIKVEETIMHGLHQRIVNFLTIGMDVGRCSNPFTDKLPEDVIRKHVKTTGDDGH